jgi:hypothetical protein
MEIKWVKSHFLKKPASDMKTKLLTICLLLVTSQVFADGYKRTGPIEGWEYNWYFFENEVFIDDLVIDDVHRVIPTYYKKNEVDQYTEYKDFSVCYVNLRKDSGWFGWRWVVNSIIRQYTKIFTNDGFYEKRDKKLVRIYPHTIGFKCEKDE